MIPTFVIGLREGLEAALIVGIVAAFLKRTGNRNDMRWMWLGVIVASVLCLSGGIALRVFGRDLPEKQQLTFEILVSLVAVGTVSWMIVWTKRHARELKSTLEERAASAVTQGTAFALVGMAFFAVMREGFETAVFLLAQFQITTSPVASATGAVVGLVTAVLLGSLIYRGGARINYARFFRVTGMVLVFVAAGVLMFAVHSAHEIGWINVLQGRAINLKWLVAPDTVRAALLTGMLGLQPEPTVAEALVWLAYVIPATLFVLLPGSPFRRRRVSTPATQEAVG